MSDAPKRPLLHWAKWPTPRLFLSAQVGRELWWAPEVHPDVPRCTHVCSLHGYSSPEARLVELIVLWVRLRVGWAVR